MIVIRSVSDIKIHNKPIEIKSSDTDKILIEKLKIITEKNKEDNIDQMMRILIEGAKEQLRYMNEIQTYGNDIAQLEQENFDFYDI